MSTQHSQTTAALLTHDHGDLDDTLAGLDRAFEAGDLARSFEHLDLFWARLAVHIRAENTALFPALLHAAEKNPADSGVNITAEEMHQLVARLRDDHDFFMFEITALIKQLRILLRENRVEGLTEIREGLMPVCERLEAHNALEESRAYQYAARLLSRDEQKVLHETIQQELERLPPRLRTQSPPASS